MVLQFVIHKLNFIILKLNNIWLRVCSVCLQVCLIFLQTGFSLQDNGLSHLLHGLFVHLVLFWPQESHEVPDHTTLGLFNSHL